MPGSITSVTDTPCDVLRAVPGGQPKTSNRLWVASKKSEPITAFILAPRDAERRIANRSPRPLAVDAEAVAGTATEESEIGFVFALSKRVAGR